MLWTHEKIYQEEHFELEIQLEEALLATTIRDDLNPFFRLTERFCRSKQSQVG